MSAHLAVAIVAHDSRDALAQARSLPAAVTLVEYRLDMMDAVDVDLLAAQTPLPAIFTCRPVAQGGHFTGSEHDRRHILQQALRTSHWVDIEMDALPALRSYSHRPGQIIGSQHDFGGMFGQWDELETEIRARGADIVKLVGMATSEADTLPPLAWLARTTGPGIAIAMGAAGVATRLLASRFSAAFLTFGALGQNSAPGQLTVETLIRHYGFQNIANAEPLIILLTPAPVPWKTVRHYRTALLRHIRARNPWLLPIPVTSVTPDLLQTLRLARAAAVLRLPEVAATEALQSIFAWDLTRAAPRTCAQSSSDAVLAFLSPGN